MFQVCTLVVIMKQHLIPTEPSSQISAQPEWIRIPRSGSCPWCGLSRSYLFALIRDGKIKSKVLRKPGNIRGIRLVLLRSVYDYIEQEGEDDHS